MRNLCILHTIPVLLALAAIVAHEAHADAYREPVPELVELVDAPVTPRVSLGPRGRTLLIAERVPLLTIQDMSAPESRLAGYRINPVNNGPSKPNYHTNLLIQSVTGGPPAEVEGLPREPRIRNLAWSPDGRYVAFTHDDPHRVTLWLLDVERATARQLYRGAVNDAFPGNPVTWAPDSRSLYVRSVAERGPAPEREAVPAGPVIQQNLGREAPARTYQDLLADAHDEKLFEYHFKSRILRVSVTGGSSAVTDAGLYNSMEASPDGEWLLTRRLERPFSYLVRAERFPTVVEVHRETGGLFHTVVKRPLAEEVPIGFDATVTGPRNVGWRSDAPATLYWVEAADGGDPRAEAEVRDRLFLHAAPFRDDPVELAAFEQRFRGVNWADGGFALAYEAWWNTRRLRAWRVTPDAPAEPKLLIDRSFEDRYNDPGRPVTVSNDAGKPVLWRGEDGRLLLFGDGASPEGDRPFADLWHPGTDETERLWRSESPYYERAEGVLDAPGLEVLTRRESETEPPNYFRRDLEDGRAEQLTGFPHPMPELAGVHKEMIHYERDDGLPLSGTLYLPPGYDKERDGPLPLVVWAYPREYVSRDAAGQVSDSPYRFTRISFWRPQFLVTQGYAVLDNATMPVVGVDGAEPNDTFIEQLVANAQAAVDAVAAMGVADPERAAIGGHSYGAFMTANILAHSDIFRAGVARSGAYNRSLTPFGFQREQRTIWDDTDLYIRMSPFFHADGIEAPLLLIHGAEDNNSGTFPMQSERLYHAIRGLGGTVRLVMLPNESHGYRARESVLHMLWETTTWLDNYVRERDDS